MNVNLSAKLYRIFLYLDRRLFSFPQITAIFVIKITAFPENTLSSK